jgi:hypothetical protein
MAYKKCKNIFNLRQSLSFSRQNVQSNIEEHNIGKKNQLFCD